MNHELGSQQLRENKNWYLFLGASLVVFGTLAVIFALTSTLVSVIYLGILLVILGLFEGIKSFKINRWSNFFLHLFLSILYIVGGIFIMLNPAINALTLTLLLAIFFVISGILKTIFALTQQITHKGWLLLNGLLTLLLGILIWAEWPYSGLWVIGTLVGIDAIITGWTWIMLALTIGKFETKK